MGPHTTLTPNIPKLNVHFRVRAVTIIYQLSHQNMLAMSLGYHIMNPEQCVLTLIAWYTGRCLAKKNDNQNKDRLYNARIQFKLPTQNVSINKAPSTSSQLIIHVKAIYIGSFIQNHCLGEKIPILSESRQILYVGMAPTRNICNT